MKKIKIAHLYYDLMNLYGENGNVRFLLKKLEDQGFDASIHFLTVDDKIDFDNYDFYYIGTGSEENKKIVLNDIMKYKENIKKAVSDGKFFLVTGNSLDLFGKNIIDQNLNEIDSLNVFDYVVKEEDFRIVGEQYFQTDLIPEKIIGFQNRNSTINSISNSLFSVIEGNGYNVNNNFEGIRFKNFFGTYLLGPLLVRNPFFTDYIIKEICNYLKTNYITPNKDASYKAYSEYIKNFYTKEN